MANNNNDAVEVLNGKKVVDPEKWKYFVFAGCFLGFMLDNVDMMATSIGLPLLLEAFNLTIIEGGFIGTSMLIGAAIGAWFWGPFADRYGRRMAYAICLGWYTVFAFFCGFCDTLTPFLILRFLCGLALGGAWTIGVAYLTDFFPEHQRGKAVAIVQGSSVVGMLLVTALVRWAVPVFTWKILFWCAIVGLPVVFYFLWLPESPTWLRKRYGADAAVAAGEAKRELGLGTLFGIREFRIALILGSLLVIFIQSGYWGANNWIPTYLTSERGLSVEAMTNVIAAMYAGALCGYVIFGAACDRFGRKKTYVVGTAYTAIMTFAYINFATDSTVLVFVALYGLGAFGLYAPLGTLISEMIPQEARARGLGFVWGMGRLASAGMPALMGALATVTSLGFCITVVAGIYVLAFVVSLLLKETRGNSMENVKVVGKEIVND